jgi:hypothetical protein
MILLSAFGLTFTALGALAADAKRPTNAYEMLRTTKVFAMGPVGFAGTRSSTEMAFRSLLKQPDAPAQFAKLLSSATPEGRIYALLGLKSVDEKAFTVAFPKFRQSKMEIHSVGGGYSGREGEVGR